MKTSIPNSQGHLDNIANGISYNSIIGFCIGVYEEIVKLHIQPSDVEQYEIESTFFQVTTIASEKAIKDGMKAAAVFGMQEALVFWGEKGAVKIIRSKGMTAILFGLVDQSISHYKYSNGEINIRKYRILTSQNVGITTFGLYGGILGASLLSFIPGIGTLIGGVIGGYIGSEFGSELCESIYLFIEDTYLKL